MDLRSILEHPAVAHGDPVVKHLLVDFTRDLVNLSDDHWNQVANADGRLDDLTASYHRGKAHVLCDVTGDQEALRQFIL